MAIYSFRMQVVSRSKGRSATAGAAYRGRMAIYDERTHEQHDYRRHNGLLDHSLLLPEHAPEEFASAQGLWNAAERAEKRKDAQIYRENLLALPHELTLEQNRALLHEFLQEHYVSRGMGAQADIHAADPHGNEKNIHAHVMLTLREIEADGFAKTKNRNWNKKETLQAWREGWAEAINRALERQNCQERVDHRTLTEQGVFREASQHLGPAVTAMERRGEHTRAGEHNRRVDEANRERAELQREQRQNAAALERAEQKQRQRQAQQREAENRREMDMKKRELAQARSAGTQASRAAKDAQETTRQSRPDPRARVEAWGNRQLAAQQNRHIAERGEQDAALYTYQQAASQAINQRYHAPIRQLQARIAALDQKRYGWFSGKQRRADQDERQHLQTALQQQQSNEQRERQALEQSGQRQRRQLHERQQREQEALKRQIALAVTRQQIPPEQKQEQQIRAEQKPQPQRHQKRGYDMSR